MLTIYVEQMNIMSKIIGNLQNAPNVQLTLYFVAEQQILNTMNIKLKF